MFSANTKKYISDRVQALLQTILDGELPLGEINFILHVDGVNPISWANIRNMNAKDIEVPDVLIGNLSK